MALLLCFNLPQAKMLRLGLYTASRGIRVMEVEPHLQRATIGQLLRGQGTRGEVAFAEEMLVMDGLSDGQMEELLRFLREDSCGISLKAVVTDTNRLWPASLLAEALKNERESYARMTKGKNTGLRG